MIKRTLETISKLSSYNLVMNIVFPETIQQAAARKLHGDCRCGFCIEKARARGIELQPATKYCSISLRRHKGKDKCGADGNYIYAHQCTHHNRTNAIIECKSRLHLLNNIDGHEGKFNTDNNTHYAVESLRKLHGSDNAFVGQHVDTGVIPGEDLGFKCISNTPQGSNALPCKDVYNGVPRKFSGPVSNCMEGAKRVPSLGMYEVVEEKTWRDVLPSKTFSSFVTTAAFGSFTPTAEVPFFVSNEEDGSDVGRVETIPAIDEMEERDELLLKEDGGTDKRKLSLIPRIGAVERHSKAFNSKQEAKRLHSDAILKLMKERLGVTDAVTAEPLLDFLNRMDKKLSYTSLNGDKKGLPYRECLATHPRYLASNTEATRRLDYKGNALRFTGVCADKPFELFPANKFSSSATILREARGGASVGTYRMVTVQTPSLMVYTKTKEGKDRIENFITNTPPLEEHGVRFTTAHVLDENWVRVEIPVDPATETQAYQTVVLQDIKTKREVAKHYRVVTVPRDGTYNEPSVRAVLTLDGYDGNEKLALYRETMTKQFLKIAHSRRRAFVNLVLSGEPKPRFLLGNYEGYNSADYKEFVPSDAQCDTSWHRKVLTSEESWALSAEIHKHIEELKWQRYVRESEQEVYAAVTVCDAWASTQKWLRNEKLHLRAKEELPDDADGGEDKHVGKCQFLRLTADPAYAFVEKWGKPRKVGTIFRVAVSDLILPKDKKERIPFAPPARRKPYLCDCITCMAEMAQHLSRIWDVRLKGVEPSPKEQRFFNGLPVKLKQVPNALETTASIKLKPHKHSKGDYVLRRSVSIEGKVSKVDYFIGQLDAKAFDKAGNREQLLLNQALAVCTNKVRACEEAERDAFRKKCNELMSKHHHNRQHKGKVVLCHACLGYEKEAEELARENDRGYAKRTEELKDWIIKQRLCLMAGATYAPTKYDLLDVSPDRDFPDSFHASFYVPEVWGDMEDHKHPLVEDDDFWGKFLTEPPEEVKETFTSLDEEDDEDDYTSDDSAEGTSYEPVEEDTADEEQEELITNREVPLAPDEHTDVARQEVDAAFLKVIGLQPDPDAVWLHRVFESFNSVSKLYVNRRYSGSLDIGLRVPLLYTLPTQGEVLDVLLDVERLAQTALTPSEWNMVLHADPEKLPEEIRYRLGSAWLELWYAMCYPKPNHNDKRQSRTPVNMNERGSN